MVVKFLFVFIAAAMLTIACGGDDGSKTGAPAERPDATAAPTSAVEGPTASVQPRSGPPGSEITVSGSGWAPGVVVDLTGQVPAGGSFEPYETALTDQAGNFTASFRLEKTPDGDDLEVGRFDLVARSATAEVDIPFLVETRRPIQNSGPGG